jgi:hypothetical protein
MVKAEACGLRIRQGVDDAGQGMGGIQERLAEPFGQERPEELELHRARQYLQRSHPCSTAPGAPPAKTGGVGASPISSRLTPNHNQSVSARAFFCGCPACCMLFGLSIFAVEAHFGSRFELSHQSHVFIVELIDYSPAEDT